MDQIIKLLLEKCPGANDAVSAFYDVLKNPSKGRILSAQIQNVRNIRCWELALRMAEIASSQEAHKNVPHFIGHQAHCLIQLKREADAIKTIDDFLEAMPPNLVSDKDRRYLSVYKSSAYCHLGKLKEAEDSLKSLPMIDNVVEQWIELKYLQNDYNEVIRLGETHKPAKHESRLQWAKSLIELRKYDDARKTLEPIIERSKEARELFNIIISRGADQGSGKRVAIVHGRHPAGQGMFNFLLAIGLDTVEFSEARRNAIKRTRQLNPHPIIIIEELFRDVRAVVVLLTGDDLAKLNPEYLKHDDGPEERGLTPQARPNVLFEGGLAYGLYPTQTILVQLGYIKPFSDITGLHVVKLDSPAARKDLIERLQLAGCKVDIEGKSHWLSHNFFGAT